MSMTLVSTTTVGAGGTQTVTFANIPQTGKDLVIKARVRGEYNDAHIAWSMLINNITTTTYPYRNLRATQSLVQTFGSSGAGSAIQVGFAPANTASSGLFCNTDIHIFDYTRSGTKVVTTQNSVSPNNTTQYAWWAYLSCGALTDAGAVTELDFYSNYADDLAEGTTFSLYIVS